MMLLRFGSKNLNILELGIILTNIYQVLHETEKKQEEVSIGKMFSEFCCTGFHLFLLLHLISLNFLLCLSVIASTFGDYLKVMK